MLGQVQDAAPWLREVQVVRDMLDLRYLHTGLQLPAEREISYWSSRMGKRNRKFIDKSSGEAREGVAYFECG